MNNICKINGKLLHLRLQVRKVGKGIDKSCFYKSRFNVRSVISQVSDINSEEESFYSNPSSSSLNSAITSNTRSRRTAATATAAAYTDKKLVPMSKAWVSGRENLSASTLRYCYAEGQQKFIRWLGGC